MQETSVLSHTSGNTCSYPFYAISSSLSKSVVFDKVKLVRTFIPSAVDQSKKKKKFPSPDL